jgi:hypothetical protein
MAEPNNAGPAPETNGLSDDRRAIIASLELVRLGRRRKGERSTALSTDDLAPIPGELPLLVRHQ